MFLKKDLPAGKKLFPRQEGDFHVDWLKFKDLKQVARLEKDAFPEPLSYRSLLRLWLMPLTRYIAFKKEKELAAYIGFQILGPIAHTISMCVHPGYRHQGLGMLVQRTADLVAYSLGARWFTGEVRVSNQAQLQMLKKLGWQEIGIYPGFFANGEDAVVVWNWLKRKN